MEDYIGYEKGERCNRNGCQGIIDEYEKEGCCSCHNNPPCDYCVTPNSYCITCEWDAAEEYREYQNIQLEKEKKNISFYEEQSEKRHKYLDLFYKKYRGEIPPDKLEIISESHTHFSMIKRGVFPKGTETIKSILPKVRGTFGGRFTSSFDENTYRFEYIAYTD